MTAAQALATGAFDILIKGNAMHKPNPVLVVKMVRQLTNASVAETIAALRDHRTHIGH